MSLEIIDIFIMILTYSSYHSSKIIFACQEVSTYLWLLAPSVYIAYFIHA